MKIRLASAADAEAIVEFNCAMALETERKELLPEVIGAGVRALLANPAAGFYVVADGTNRPWRVKSRAPSLLACQALAKMIVGGLIADVIAVIGSIDVVMGDVDR